MLLRSFLSALTALFLLVSPAHAGVLDVQGRKIYVDYAPAAAGEPTLVLLNGLTYSTANWDAYVKELERRRPGLGVLRFDMIAMGQTLLEGTHPVNYAVPYTDQVELTAKLMGQLGIRSAFVAGLSYGGGIAVAFGAAHPELVEQLVLMAPFTEPLKAMDQFINNEVAANRFTFSLNPATNDELYDYFLHQFIFATYPSLEPSVLDNDYKLEGVFRMVQGIRKYDTLEDAKGLPALSTHLLVAGRDQYIEKEVQNRFWKAVPLAARASRIDIAGTEHKMPEAIPAFAAAWTVEILSHRPELNRGLTFQGNPDDFVAHAGSVKLQLPR